MAYLFVTYLSMKSTTNNTRFVENFKEWACSFSGCDGGDVDSPVWLCGIEWRYRRTKGQSVDEYKNELQKFGDRIREVAGF